MAHSSLRPIIILEYHREGMQRLVLLKDLPYLHKIGYRTIALECLSDSTPEKHMGLIRGNIAKLQPLVQRLDERGQSNEKPKEKMNIDEYLLYLQAKSFIQFNALYTAAKKTGFEFKCIFPSDKTCPLNSKELLACRDKFMVKKLVDYMELKGSDIISINGFDHYKMGVVLQKFNPISVVLKATDSPLTNLLKNPKLKLDANKEYLEIKHGDKAGINVIEGSMHNVQHSVDAFNTLITSPVPHGHGEL